MVWIYYHSNRKHLGILIVGQKVQNELLLGVIDLDKVGIDPLQLFAIKGKFYFFHAKEDEPTVCDLTGNRTPICTVRGYRPNR